jgi:secreted trypsin-like serine protease
VSECHKKKNKTSKLKVILFLLILDSGDWPFHVFLLKRQSHACDGTLVSPHWVLTTSSCFQGQSREKWTAVFGGLRIGMNAPWTQKRRIVRHHQNLLYS